MISAISKRLLVVIAAWVAACPACDLFDRPAEKVVLTVGNRKITPEEWRTQRKRVGLELAGTGQERLDAFVDRVVDHYLILEYGKE